MAFDDNQREFSIGELENANTDRSTNPAVMVRGMMVKSGGTWYYAGDDAGKFRVSALGVSVTTSPLSADSSSISALQGDASLLHVSAFLDNGSVSAKSADANQVHVSAVQGDANFLHVSAFLDNGSVSAKSADANQVHVSAVQGDANFLHVSAFLDNGSVSAKSADANQLHVSAVQGDAGLHRASAIQGDAGLAHVSASLFPDTTGGLTVFQTLSVSASQNVKGTAGALYGYYIYNSDKNYNFVKFYNVSAAALIGTDTPLITIGLPPSAAANMEYPHGLAGFTNGINITATSGRPLDNTTLPPASSVGAVLFYK